MSYEAVTWALQQPKRRIVRPGCWLDTLGKEWPLPKESEPLSFQRRAHAALRAHLYARDGYRCCECGSTAEHVPLDYDGCRALFIKPLTKKGRSIPLVLDHIVSLRNGGKTRPENLRTLCATCNNLKATQVDRVWGRR